MINEIKFNDADEYDTGEECLEEVDEKCPHCNTYMRQAPIVFFGQRDFIVRCEDCNYSKAI